MSNFVSFYILGGFCFAKTGFTHFAHAHPLPSLRSVQWTASQVLQSLPHFKEEKFLLTNFKKNKTSDCVFQMKINFTKTC